MTTHEYEAQVLDSLTRAVAAALERKRRLGQYAVVWRDNRPVCIGSDAPGQCDSAPEGPASKERQRPHPAIAGRGQILGDIGGTRRC